MNTSTPEAPKTPSPLKILLMGKEGTRKTTLGLQFPELHVMDCDRNLDGPVRICLKGVTENGKIIVPPIKPDLSFTYDDIRKDDNGTENHIEECYNRLCDKLKLFCVDEAYKKRKTVFVDSLSHVNEFIIRHVLHVQQKSKNTYLMEQRDWSPFKSFAYQFLVARLEETGKTILCSCHELKLYENDPKNQSSKIVTGYEPMFQGAVGDSLGAFFTDVWRLEVKPAPGGKNETWLITDKIPKCDVLKNSLGMPKELNITTGFSVLEPYLKGRI